MRTVLAALTLLLATPSLALIVVVASYTGGGGTRQGIIFRCMRFWCRSLVAAAGVRVRVHNPERLDLGRAGIYVANHVSWFDVFVLGSVLPHYTFIAKAELERIPIFGRAARAAGVIFIQRENRKAAFDAYKVAASKVQAGRSVIVFPEGTRGVDYHLRPFKKGPFVLAIAAGAPIVPAVIHGTIRVMPKNSFLVRGGEVDVHLLDPVETAGHGYDEREALMLRVWGPMAELLRDEYAIGTNEHPIARVGGG